MALTLQSFYRSFMAMDYHFNLPEYLAKCINKNQQQLACEGQCILMKKIAEKEKQESEKNLVAHEYNVLYVHKEFAVFAMRQPSEEARESGFPPYVIDYGFEYNTPVFRPPIG